MASRSKVPCFYCGEMLRTYLRSLPTGRRACRSCRSLRPTPGPIDQVSVDRACKGEQVRLSGPERYAAFAQLRGQGCSKTRIARTLRMSGTSVKKLDEVYQRSTTGHAATARIVARSVVPQHDGGARREAA